MQSKSLQVLDILKKNGQQTSQQLAVILGITSMGARQSLLKLREQGLVLDYSKATKKGRPNQYWYLTEKGHEQFESNYDGYCNSILSSVRQLFGEESVIDLIADQERKQLLEYSQSLLSAKSMTEKLELLSKMREKDGFMPRLERLNGENMWSLAQYNCPIRNVAKSCPAICQSEQSLFKKLLGETAEIYRANHIASGDHACTYVITLKMPTKNRSNAKRVDRVVA